MTLFVKYSLTILCLFVIVRSNCQEVLPGNKENKIVYSRSWDKSVDSAMKVLSNGLYKYVNKFHENQKIPVIFIKYDKELYEVAFDNLTAFYNY